MSVEETTVTEGGGGPLDKFFSWFILQTTQFRSRMIWRAVDCLDSAM